MKERLQKHLARAGLGSRRYCETLIEQGRVAVNGTVVDRVGFQVDPESDSIAVDGSTVKVESAVYYLLHKPKGFVCSNRPQGSSRSALELVRGRHGERLFCVGRLDEQSQGALLLTNDGEFSNRVIHPRYGVEKTYLVCVKGKPEGTMLDKIRKGVHLAEGKTAPAKVHVVKRSRSHSLIKVTLHEGKNRHLRRIFARIGLPVTEIIRLQIGSLSLGSMKAGQYRELKPAEIAGLLEESQPGSRRMDYDDLVDAKDRGTRGRSDGAADGEAAGFALPKPRPDLRKSVVRPAGRGGFAPRHPRDARDPRTSRAGGPATKGPFAKPGKSDRPFGRSFQKARGRTDHKNGPRGRKGPPSFPPSSSGPNEDVDDLFDLDRMDSADDFDGPDSETDE